MPLIPRHTGISCLRDHPEIRRRYVGLVGCGKRKRSRASRARDLYTGPLTRSVITWMDRNSDCWYILSAKYGLLKPDEWVIPYNLRVTDLPKSDQAAWGKRVSDQLKEFHPDRLFLTLAGADYLSLLSVPAFDPLHGLSVGKRLSWLKSNPVLTKSLISAIES